MTWVQILWMYSDHHGIEEEFDIEIPSEEAEKIVTVGDAVEQIKKRRKLNSDYRKEGMFQTSLFSIERKAAAFMKKLRKWIENICFITVEKEKKTMENHQFELLEKKERVSFSKSPSLEAGYDPQLLRK